MWMTRKASIFVTPYAVFWFRKCEPLCTGKRKTNLARRHRAISLGGGLPVERRIPYVIDDVVT
jgi:hypothetical protein